MNYSAFILRGVAASALLFATASPALAQSRTDRARMAISEAQARVDSAIKVGAAAEAPELVAEAQSELRSSQENLERGNKDEAIAGAHRSSELADQALGVTERNKSIAAAAERDRRQSAESAAVAAQADADVERDRRQSAEAAAGAAQQDAASANGRADQAQQAASSAAADAAAARAAAAKPTTVTVERTEGTVTTPAYSVRRATPARRPAARPAPRRAPAKAAPAQRRTTTTTTTIKTEQPPQ